MWFLKFLKEMSVTAMALLSVVGLSGCPLPHEATLPTNISVIPLKIEIIDSARRDPPCSQYPSVPARVRLVLGVPRGNGAVETVHSNWSVGRIDATRVNGALRCLGAFEMRLSAQTQIRTVIPIDVEPNALELVLGEGNGIIPLPSPTINGVIRRVQFNSGTGQSAGVQTLALETVFDISNPSPGRPGILVSQIDSTTIPPGRRAVAAAQAASVRSTTPSARAKQ